MGSIPEYNRQQLASSYVGAAQKDSSTALAVGAVQEAVEPVFKNELQNLKKERDFHAEQEANNILAQGSLAAQRLIMQKERALANNPEAAPEEIQSALPKLWDEYSKAIPNTLVRNKVLTGFSQIQRAVIPSTVARSLAQREHITRVALKSTVGICEQAAGDANNVYDLTISAQSAYSAINPDTTKLTPLEAAKAMGLTPEEQEKLSSDTVSNMMDTFMNKQIQVDPIAAIDLAKKGLVVPVQTASGVRYFRMDREKSDKYITMAKSYALRKQSERDLDIVLASSGEVIDTTQQFLNNEKSFSQILDYRDKISKNPETPEATKKAADAMVRLAYKAKEDPTDLSPSELYKSVARLDAIQKDIKKGTSPKGKLKNPENYTTQVVEFYTDTLDKVEKGLITRKDAQSMLKEVAYVFSQSVIAQRGQYNWTAKMDPNSKYFGQIDAKLTSLNVPTKVRDEAKGRAFGGYISRLSEANATGIATEADRTRFAKEAYMESVQYYFPEVAATMTDESVNSIANQKDGVTAVHTAPTNLKANSKVKYAYKDGDIKIKNNVTYERKNGIWVEKKAAK